MEQVKDYVSIGMMAQHLQRSVPDIKSAVSRLGFEPALTLNSIAYFDWSQVDSIGAMLGKPGPTVYRKTR